MHKKKYDCIMKRLNSLKWSFCRFSCVSECKSNTKCLYCQSFERSADVTLYDEKNISDIINILKEYKDE